MNEREEITEIYKGEELLIGSGDAPENAEESPTPKKDRRRVKKAVLYCFAIAVLILGVVCSVVAPLGYNANMSRAKNLKAVGSRLNAEFDEAAGCYALTTDEPLKILYLTDLHFGAGHFTARRDGLVISSVETLVRREKPDLVIVTGDVAFPMSITTGSLDNLKQLKLFTAMMTSLDVNYTYVYGNHDPEGLYSQRELDSYLSSVGGRFLYMSGPSSAEGYGNHCVAVRNSAGEYTQVLIMLDTHSRERGSLRYASLLSGQIAYYRKTVSLFKGLSGGKTVPSLIFQHIPDLSYKTAWLEYKKNGYKDTENVKYYYGVCDESVSPGRSPKPFAAILEEGSTQGIFAGHDHVNNFSVSYKGVRLTYGMSIDYTAYVGIELDKKHRGGTRVTVNPDGSFDCALVPLGKDL